MKKITIDCGHGGKDSGTVKGTLKESDIVLSIGLKVKELLKNSNIEVQMTREDDSFIPLGTRASMANENKSDIFISLHVNGHEVSYDEDGEEIPVNGFESFIFSGTSKLQDCLHDTIAPYFLRDRGKKTAKFVVLKKTKMKAVLLEFGFLTSSSSSALIDEDHEQQAIAMLVVEGIKKYYAECDK